MYDDYTEYGPELPEEEEQYSPEYIAEEHYEDPRPIPKDTIKNIVETPAAWAEEIAEFGYDLPKFIGGVGSMIWNAIPIIAGADSLSKRVPIPSFKDVEKGLGKAYKAGEEKYPEYPSIYEDRTYSPVKMALSPFSLITTGFGEIAKIMENATKDTEYRGAGEEAAALTRMVSYVVGLKVQGNIAKGSNISVKDTMKEVKKVADKTKEYVELGLKPKEISDILLKEDKRIPQSVEGLVNYFEEARTNLTELNMTATGFELGEAMRGKGSMIDNLQLLREARSVWLDKAEQFKATDLNEYGLRSQMGQVAGEAAETVIGERSVPGKINETAKRAAKYFMETGILDLDIAKPKTPMGKVILSGKSEPYMGDLIQVEPKSLIGGPVRNIPPKSSIGDLIDNIPPKTLMKDVIPNVKPKTSMGGFIRNTKPKTLMKDVIKAPEETPLKTPEQIEVGMKSIDESKGKVYTEKDLVNQKKLTDGLIKELEQEQMTLEQEGKWLDHIEINKEMLKNHQISLVGRTVKDIKGLGKLAQIYRDNRYETFRIFYIKDKVIVGQEGISSGLPGMVDTPAIRSMTDRIETQMKEFNADGFFSQHNHPRGASDPSVGDVATIRGIYEQLPDSYRGDIIIDFDTYNTAYFNKAGKLKSKTKRISKVKGKKDAINTYLGGREITDEHLVDIAQASADLTKTLTLVYTDVQYGIYTIKAIQEVPNQVFKNYDSALKFIKNSRQKFGGDPILFLHQKDLTKSIPAGGKDPLTSSMNLLGEMVTKGLIREVNTIGPHIMGKDLDITTICTRNKPKKMNAETQYCKPDMEYSFGERLHDIKNVQIDYEGGKAVEKPYEYKSSTEALYDKKYIYLTREFLKVAKSVNAGSSTIGYSTAISRIKEIIKEGEGVLSDIQMRSMQGELKKVVEWRDKERLHLKNTGLTKGEIDQIQNIGSETIKSGPDKPSNIIKNMKKEFGLTDAEIKQMQYQNNRIVKRTEAEKQALKKKIDSANLGKDEMMIYPGGPEITPKMQPVTPKKLRQLKKLLKDMEK